MIDGRAEAAIAASRFKVLVLFRSHGDVTFAFGAYFLTIGSGVESAGTAVVTDAGDVRVVVDDRRVIGVVNDVDVYVGHGAVVVVIPAAPVTSEEADACVAEAVVNSAVEADGRAPVASVPHVEAFVPTPIAWGPEEAGFRRNHPRARNPEVVLVLVFVSPVARGPDVAWARANRLCVNGQNRGADANGDADGDLSL